MLHNSRLWGPGHIEQVQHADGLARSVGILDQSWMALPKKVRRLLQHAAISARPTEGSTVFWPAPMTSVLLIVTCSLQVNRQAFLLMP